MNWIKKLFRREKAQPSEPAVPGPDTTTKTEVARPPSQDDFAALVLARLRIAGENGFTYDPTGFRIQKGSRQGFLDNSYAEYCRALDAHRENIIRNIVAMMTSSQEEHHGPLEGVRDQLVTVVREHAYFSLSDLDLKIHGAGQPLAAVAAPLTRWFARTLVIDAPTHMSLVNESTVAGWHHTSDELFAIGWENLCNCTEPRFSENLRVFRGMWNDDYDGSRVLVPGLFDALGLDGEPVVTIPNRGTLLVTGSNESDAIRRMLELAEQIVQKEPRPQNPAPLVVRPDGLADFHVDPTSPVFDAVQRAHRFAALWCYQEQKTKLEILHAREGKALDVAKYTLIQSDGGLYCSYAVWPKNTPTLLPIVDEVEFVDLNLPEDRQCVARIPWERVVEFARELLLDARLFPERYYVSGFPTEAQFARMRR